MRSKRIRNEQYDANDGDIRIRWSRQRRNSIIIGIGFILYIGLSILAMMAR